MKVTKLDAYDYSLYPGIIRIRLKSTNDPDLTDIMSELRRSEGRIYVDGLRVTYTGTYRVFNRGLETYLELDVSEMV